MIGKTVPSSSRLLIQIARKEITMKQFEASISDYKEKLMTSKTSKELMKCNVEHCKYELDHVVNVMRSYFKIQKRVLKTPEDYFDFFRMVMTFRKDQRG